MAEYIFLKYSRQNNEWNIFAVDVISVDEAAIIFLRRLKRRKNGFVGCFDVYRILRRVTAIKSAKVKFPVRGYIRLGGAGDEIKLQEALQKRGKAVVCQNPRGVCKRKARGSHGKLFCCVGECDRFIKERKNFIRDEESREEDKRIRLNCPELSSA